MPERELMTPAELRAIEGHLYPLIDSLQSSLREYERLPVANKDVAVKNQMAYWRNAVSAFRWAIGIARQRTKVVEDGERSTV